MAPTISQGITAFLCLATISRAAPASSGLNPAKYVDVVANFDPPEYPRQIQGTGAFITPVGVSKGIFFPAFVVLDGGDSLAAPLFPPPSSPNVITAATQTEIQFKEKQGFRADYPNSDTVAFDLKSLCYACGVNTETPTGIASGCTLRFDGVKYGSKQTVTKDLVYKPSSSPPYMYTCITFDAGFQKLTAVNITITKATTAIATTVDLFDKIAFRRYF